MGQAWDNANFGVNDRYFYTSDTILYLQGYMHRFEPQMHSIRISLVYIMITFKAHYTWMCWMCNITFIQHWPKNGQIVIDRGAVPASPSELVLALLDANLHPLSHTGHYFNVVPAETQLLGHQTWDAATEDRLSAQ